MSRNETAKPIWIAYVAVPGGANTLHLDEAAARIYNSDPDGYAAEHFGLTKIEYLQWVDSDGAPMCAHRTAGGDLCRNMTGGYQLGPDEWKTRHRKVLCAVHARTKKK